VIWLKSFREKQLETRDRLFPAGDGQGQRGAVEARPAGGERSRRRWRRRGDVALGQRERSGGLALVVRDQEVTAMDAEANLRREGHRRVIGAAGGVSCGEAQGLEESEGR
jgi:hypothetical protein